MEDRQILELLRHGILQEFSEYFPSDIPQELCHNFRMLCEEIQDSYESLNSRYSTGLKEFASAAKELPFGYILVTMRKNNWSFVREYFAHISAEEFENNFAKVQRNVIEYDPVWKQLKRRQKSVFAGLQLLYQRLAKLEAQLRDHEFA